MNKRNRRGNTLIYFVFFFLIVFGLGTLVIDIGLAQLTRRQLQTAVNTAAKEVLYDVDSNGDGMGDGRENARRFVRAVFDDDFGSTTIDTLNLGAGPDVPYYDGYQISGDFHASAKYYLPDDSYDLVPAGRSAVGVYKPDLALNPNNDPTGDIVPGTFNEIESAPSKDHEEGDDGTGNNYARDDFTPNLSGNSVLVRMRRIGEESFDDPDAGTSGPPVPFIFGRGLLSAGSSDFWSRIERGTYVRATAIANATPARTVGVRDDALGVTGLFNVQIDATLWQTTPGNNLQRGDSNYSSQVQVFNEPTSTSIGRSQYADDANASLIGDGNNGGYVVLTDDVLGERLVVGFGFVSSIQVTGSQVSFQRAFPQPIAKQNASATLAFRDSAADQLTSTNASLVFQRNFDLANQGFALRAPALVRSTE
ncbi:hypothetical protein DTL42_19455 [Bremerella cremea]|uniref:Putative Flp pilus-assembly TadG-like N-terminal domain-containing protein n=1 Tax=Bremerella cremea TaxID=1031537 RepID=A0A368KMG2_9BACT|nr:Tad domain-containing protein [Bremerella cremea]RCS42317.1 hypothetical protein DTL42_19455 [Bremerella cremea]